MQKTQLMSLAANAPAYVTQLVASYGAPSQAGFGSAVFYQPLQPSEDLQAAALTIYQFFVSDLWERYGADAWLGPWKTVYVRTSGAPRDIVAELRSIRDRSAASSISLILDELEQAEQARAALATAYDDPTVAELAVYTIGDGAAMSGILLAGRRKDPETATFLVFLMD